MPWSPEPRLEEPGTRHRLFPGVQRPLVAGSPGVLGTGVSAEGIFPSAALWADLFPLGTGALVGMEGRTRGALPLCSNLDLGCATDRPDNPQLFA